MVRRGLIVARMRPGGAEQVAKIFAESDATELPRLTGVRHRSLFLFKDVYVHLVEVDDDFEQAVDGVREHDLFREISARLEPYIEAYDPLTWRAPKDAMASEFYSWDAEDAG